MHVACPETRVVNSAAPTRICDNGGWTDTWFSRRGAVFNIAICPCVEVQVIARRAGPDDAGIKIDLSEAEEEAVRSSSEQASRMVRAVLRYLEVPPDFDLQISVFSRMPPGSSTGTSSSFIVALLSAFERLRHPPGSRSRLTAAHLAKAAHQVESEILGQQCGVQDQIAAAFGGVNFIEIDPYPIARVRPLHLEPSVASELERRLSLIFVGQAHCSSAVHEMVIRDLSDAEHSTLQPLREAAVRAAAAAVAGDLAALGDALVDNTVAQSNLHRDLVGAAHRQIIQIAQSHRAWGWKVNGAGGDGGSVTILHGPDLEAKQRLCDSILSCDPGFQLIPISLAEAGVRAWEPQLQMVGE